MDTVRSDPPSVGGGVAYRIEPLLWRRGTGRLSDGEVSIPGIGRPYELQVNEREMVFALGSIHRPNEVLGFVKKYGLLWHGPNDPDGTESIEDWLYVAGEVRLLAGLYEDLRRALRGDDNKVVARLAGAAPAALDLLSRLTTEWSSESRVEDQISAAEVVSAGQSYITSFTREVIAIALTWRLRDVRHGVFAPEGADTFLLAAQPRNVFEAAYHQLATLVVDEVELRSCIECGIAFVPRDLRQKYCSDRCGGRVRQRRYEEKKRGSN